MLPTFKLRIIFIAIGFGATIQANAQWWNPLAPKTMEECILQNMKGVTSNDAAGLVAQACARKFPKEESEEGKKKKNYLNDAVWTLNLGNPAISLPMNGNRILKNQRSLFQR